MTWKTGSTAGYAAYTSALVQKLGNAKKEDVGKYKYYAGPVKVTAPGKARCPTGG